MQQSSVTAALGHIARHGVAPSPVIGVDVPSRADAIAYVRNLEREWGYLWSGVQSAALVCDHGSWAWVIDTNDMQWSVWIEGGAIYGEA